MYRIPVVPLQAAVRTVEAHLGRIEMHGARFRNKVTPKIMIATVINRPIVPGSVMSPSRW